LRHAEKAVTMEIVEWEPRTRFIGRFRPQLSGVQVLLSPYLKRWLRRHRRADVEKLKATIARESGP
jgi:hypothetical protein